MKSRQKYEEIVLSGQRAAFQKRTPRVAVQEEVALRVPFVSKSVGKAADERRLLADFPD
jgi:hypothetical protein